jgi:hypothetical protein
MEETGVICVVISPALFEGKMDKKILRQIMTQLTVSVPVGGKALGNLCENAAYKAAKDAGEIAGCPVIVAGGKKRMPTAPIRRALGLDEGKAA